MKKLVPDTLLTDREQVQLSALSMWVLDHGATRDCHDRATVSRVVEAIAVMPRF